MCRRGPGSHGGHLGRLEESQGVEGILGHLEGCQGVEGVSGCLEEVSQHR